MGADKVWWRMSDTHVRAVDWETVSRRQAYLLVCERSGGCKQRGVCCVSAQPLVCYLTLAPW